MKDNKFNFCPECGSPNIQTLMGGRKWYCPECKFDLYNNVASAVGLVIENSQGEFLFEKRAKEPRRGFLAFPGGFSDPDESAEEAAFRECEEETGVKPERVKYLCSFPNTYVYKSVAYKTCDLFFLARLPQGCKLKGQESEVQAFEWVKIQNQADLERLPLAFDSARKTMEFYLANKEANK